MIYFRGTTNFKVEGESAVTLGKFDGIHLGHQELIRNITAKKDDGLTSVVFTFDILPRKVIVGTRQLVTMTNYERRCILEDMGVEVLVECPFVPEIYKMDPEEFISKILVERLNAKYITVGRDFRFGHYAKGNVDFLREKAEQYGYELSVIEDQKYKDVVVHSSLIRQLIAEGNLKEAAAMLGRPYSFVGQMYVGMYTYFLSDTDIKIWPPEGEYRILLTSGDKKTEGTIYVPRDAHLEKHFPVELLDKSFNAGDEDVELHFVD